jgi:membrane protease YdiL (CAAX protease family)
MRRAGHGRRKKHKMSRSLSLWAQRPITLALLLTVGWIALGLGIGAAAMALAPQYQPDFITLCVLSGVVALLLTGLGWWRIVGFNAPSAWRELRLLWLPAVVTLVLPFLAGVNLLDASTAVYLTVAYALTGFMEEAWSRGIILQILRPTGVLPTVVYSALFFALLHATNFLFRNPAIVLAQMVGAFCFGVAYAALRIRTNTLWFLVLLHALHDLLLRYSNFPLIPLDVVQDILLVAYGFYLIRHHRALDEAARLAFAPAGSAALPTTPEQ